MKERLTTRIRIFFGQLKHAGTTVSALLLVAALVPGALLLLNSTSSGPPPIRCGLIEDWASVNIFLIGTVIIAIVRPYLAQPILRVLGWAEKAQGSAENQAIGHYRRPLIVLIAFTVLGIANIRFTSISQPFCRPAIMSGEFNVAISRFAVPEEAQSYASVGDSLALAGFLHDRLEIAFEQANLPFPHELWGASYVGEVTGLTRESRQRAAQELAEQIGANLVIYGVISGQEGECQLLPEFYVHYKGFEEGEEITGQHGLGSSLEVSCPFELTQFQGVFKPSLVARAEALSLITIGLSYYANDDFEGALRYFARAEELDGWPSTAGKEVLYLLMGNTNIRLASLRKDSSFLEPADEFYGLALEIDDSYPRALLGQAGVLYLKALGEEQGDFSTVDLGGMQAAESGYRAALAYSDMPSGANIIAKSQFGIGQVYLVRSVVLGGDWLSLAEENFGVVIQEFEPGNDALRQLAGHSHARLARIALLARGDYSEAENHYQAAIELVSPPYAADYLSALAEIYAATSRIDLAIASYEKAVQMAELSGDEARYGAYSEALLDIKSRVPEEGSSK